MKCLNSEWPAVLHSGRRLYGGNQDLFERRGIQRSGCGLIAAADTLRYLELNGRAPESSEFWDSAPDAMTWERYEEVGLKLNRRFVRIFPPFGANGLTLAWGMNRFFRRYHVPLHAKWGVGRGKLWTSVAQMLDLNLPVILSIGPNWPLFWRHRGVGLYLSPKNAGPATHVDGHYVTVTGMDECWLRVSSWGRIYYIRRDEFEYYSRKYSCNLFSNCLLLMEK